MCFFLSKIAGSHFLGLSLYSMGHYCNYLFACTYLSTPIPAFLLPGKPHCWINPTLFPLFTCICSVESAQRKTKLYVWCIYDLTGLVQAPNNTLICWGQPFSPLPVDNLVLFFSYNLQLMAPPYHHLITMFLQQYKHWRNNKTSRLPPTHPPTHLHLCLYTVPHPCAYCTEALCIFLSKANSSDLSIVSCLLKDLAPSIIPLGGFIKLFFFTGLFPWA